MSRVVALLVLATLAGAVVTAAFESDSMALTLLVPVGATVERLLVPLAVVQLSAVEDFSDQ